MKKFYSPTTKGFYPEDMRSQYEAAGTWPADAFEVNEEQEAALRAPQPILFNEAAALFLADVRATREAILNRLAGIGLAALVDGDSGVAEAIAQARRQLLDITEAPEVLTAIEAENLDALEEAVKARYKAIAAGVPLEVRNAFNKVSL
jgi:hypothetical protein